MQRRCDLFGSTTADASARQFASAPMTRRSQTTVSARSKLANMVFGAALKDKLEARGSKVKVMAAAPGIASSQLASTTGRSGGGLGLGVIMRCAQSEEDGAMPLLECIARPGLESGTFVTPSHKGLIGLLWGDAVRGPPQSHLPESICTRESSKQLLWTCFESATGPFFR